MSFNLPVSVDEELDVVSERVYRLDGHRVDPSEEHIEEIANRPAPFEPVAELRCLSSRTWTRTPPPSNG